ncbi:MAG: hypothetical protein FJ207_02845 [Gemmatimonadetes bacterium]|nr:hypothetical protein [Gemmatimonadota bacterium]
MSAPVVLVVEDNAELRAVLKMEDEEIVEATQRGVRSRLYDRGQYSPRREQVTHHFHSLLQRFLP